MKVSTLGADAGRGGKVHNDDDEPPEPVYGVQIEIPYCLRKIGSIERKPLDSKENLFLPLYHFV